MPARETIRRRHQVRGPVRWLVETGVLLGIAGTMASEFLVEGWLAPIVVSSGSMATTLLGPHRMANCPDCGMEFACDATESFEGIAATCPNCGRRRIALDRPLIAGDRLLVDRATYGLREPRRWEVALFRCPECASDYCVKRVVGLPGETIEIRGGDVFVDGKIARKSLARQREMAVLVHDTAWAGDDRNLPNRWSSQSDGGWQPTDGGWRYSPPVRHAMRAETPSSVLLGTHRMPYEWLNYIHWHRTSRAATAIEESPILDEVGYNQTASRQLNRVTDLMLVCNLSAIGDGVLLIKAHDGREGFQVSIAPATGSIELSRSDRVVQTVQAAARLLEGQTELVLSLIDRQVILAIGGRDQIVYEYEPLDDVLARSGDRATTVSAPFSLGASDLDVEVARLQVLRDVYYTPPTRAGDLTACHLGPDQYYVLGDNSPISRDSRSWTGGGVVRGPQFVGRAVKVFHRAE